MESSGQSASLIVNMIMYLMALGGFLVFVAVLYVLLKVKGLKSKIQRVIEGIKKKTFWNNTIRSITISYLETAIQLRNKMQLLPAVVELGQLGPLYGIGAFLIGYPAVCFHWLVKNRDKLETKEARSKCGKLYTGIALYRSYNVIFYYPAFMIRRVVFVFIPIILAGYSTFQIQSLVLISSFYLIWYGTIQPYIQHRATCIETFNEFMFLCLIYHLFLFSHWTTFE